MYEDVKTLIQSAVGYEVKEGDLPLLAYLHNEVSRHIKNECNIEAIPSGLLSVLAAMTAGKFLALKKEAILGAAGFEVVKSIREGDTTVELGGSNNEQRYASLVKLLTRERDFSCYRRFRW